MQRLMQGATQGMGKTTQDTRPTLPHRGTARICHHTEGTIATDPSCHARPRRQRLAKRSPTQLPDQRADDDAASASRPRTTNSAWCIAMRHGVATIMCLRIDWEIERPARRRMQVRG
jgi:hypothetical protein